MAFTIISAGAVIFLFAESKNLNSFAAAFPPGSPLGNLPGYINNPPVYVNPNETPDQKGWIKVGENGLNGQPRTTKHCFDIGSIPQITSGKVRYVMLLNASNISAQPGADPMGIKIYHNQGNTYDYPYEFLNYNHTGWGLPHSRGRTAAWVKMSDGGHGGYTCSDNNALSKTLDGPYYLRTGQYGRWGNYEDFCGTTKACGCSLGSDPTPNNYYDAAGGYLIFDVACTTAGGFCNTNFPEDSNRLIVNGPGNDFCVYEVGTEEAYSIWVLDYGTTNSTPTPIPPSPTPTLAPFMLTAGGDAFSQMAVTFGSLFLQNTLGKISNLQNPNLAALNLQNKKPFFASYNFLQGSAGILSCQNCSGLNNANKNYFTGNYSDQNTTPVNGWYNFITAKLTKSDLIDVTVNSLPNLDDESQLPASIRSKNGVGVINVLNSLTVNSGFICNSQTVFLIKDDLTLSPDFLVGGNDKACLFVAGGTTRVTAGMRKSAPGSVNYDILHTFIITGQFATADDSSGNLSDGLAIIGSVIADNITFGRRVDTVDPFSPAEVISYDNRYLNIFKNVLDEAINFSIREKPYIDAVNNNLL